MDQTIISELSRIVGSRHVFTARRDLLAYAYDATGGSRVPDVVVFPSNTSEVSSVMRFAQQRRVPVVPRGAGTNLSGGTVPTEGGIVLELSRMNRILEIDVANRRVVVEPGVVNLDLQNALAPLGYFYAPDPASQKVSTLGGNAAENSGGPHCLKYGVTSNHILGMEVVLMGGEIVSVGGMVEDVPGYDLTGIIVGSEGTFGVITRLMLRITCLPEKVKTMLAVFECLEDAGDTVSKIIADGIVPATLELMDQAVVGAVEASVHAGYPLDAEAVLLIEVDGRAVSLDRLAAQITEACNRHNAREVRVASTEAERDALWLGRRGAFGAVARIRPSYLVQDGTVPRTRLTQALREVARIADKYDLLVGNIAHAGDGNLHPLFMFDHKQPGSAERVHQAGKEILAACVALGGTLTGEHGIGIEKQDSLPLLFGPGEMQIAREIKMVFDPHNLLNPGKVIPKAAEAVEQDGTAPDSESPLFVHPLVSSEDTSQRVVNPSSTDEAAALVRMANQSGVPLNPCGSGACRPSGDPSASRGITLSLSKLNRILEVDAGNQTVTAEAGLRLSDLDRELRHDNLWLPLDPDGSHSITIGGMIASNASGPRRLRYGTARDYVLGLRVVTPTGDVVRLGGKTVKDVAGYDLRKMMIGSWGTLGVITEATLRLIPTPESSVAPIFRFASLDLGISFCNAILTSQLIPSCLELLNSRAAEAFAGQLGWRGAAIKDHDNLVFVGLEGMIEEIELQSAELREIAQRFGGEVPVALDVPDAAIWAARGSPIPNLASRTPGSIQIRASLPITGMRDVLQTAQDIQERCDFPVVATCQAGNGVVHLLLQPSPDTASASLAEALGHLQTAALNGSGVFLLEEAPDDVKESLGRGMERSDFRLMRDIKSTLDPNNILNPGGLAWMGL